MSFIEDLSATDFMQHLEARLVSALDENEIDELVLTISCIHRDISGNVPSVMEFTSVDEQNVRHETSMSFDQIADVMEYISVKAAEKKIILNQYPVSIIHQAMLNAFEQEVDTEEMQQQILDTVFPRAIMQGLASHLTITLNADSLSLNYDLMAEIYADTSVEEKKLAQQLGLTNFTASHPSKLVKLLTLQAGSFQNILE